MQNVQQKEYYIQNIELGDVKCQLLNKTLLLQSQQLQMHVLGPNKNMLVNRWRRSGVLFNVVKLLATDRFRGA